MRNFILVVLISIAALSCRKDDAGEMMQARIIDYHNTTGCSKGWIIETSGLTFRAETMPEEQKLKDRMAQSGLPIEIMVNFNASGGQSYCSDIYRTVTKWQFSEK